MGLSSTLSNALGGMNASQRGIDVVSRNIANQGTPGYHRESLVIEETSFGTSAQVRASTLSRAFSEALEKQHLVAVSSASYHSVQAGFLNRLQMHIGQPGDANSLDSLYAGFENALQSLATNPNDVTTRAGAINAAQQLVEQLNTLTGAVQEMRGETESLIANGVSQLNRELTQLADVNVRVLDQTQDQQARLALMDERDRLVASISEKIDVKPSYRQDGTVALMTGTGVGILDVEPSQFEFSPSGLLVDQASEVGQLTLRTPSGFQLDMGNLLSSGSLKSLIDLRDGTLVDTQNQLDEIAAGLAQAMNTVVSHGSETAEDSGIYELDLAGMQAGNSVSLSFGNQKVLVVAVNDAASLPLTSPNAAGERVIGVDISGGDPAAAFAQALADDSELAGQLSFTDAGSSLVVENGTSTMSSLVSRITAGGNGDESGALNLFVDTRNGAFTNSLDGGGQKRGFAGRISVNTNLISNNELLVRYDGANTSLGDPKRPEFLLNSIKSMTFVSEKMTHVSDGGVRLSGKVSEMIGQTINHQGNMVARAQSLESANMLTLESITTRMSSEYGVNVDEEMSRLIQLQNAYSASARVVSTVQELIDALLRM